MCRRGFQLMQQNLSVPSAANRAFCNGRFNSFWPFCRASPWNQSGRVLRAALHSQPHRCGNAVCSGPPWLES